ncbi:MAG: hypothetical protein ABSG68_09540, partial [Thermoguttaceae bacterium]
MGRHTRRRRRAILAVGLVLLSGGQSCGQWLDHVWVKPPSAPATEISYRLYPQFHPVPTRPVFLPKQYGPAGGP